MAGVSKDWKEREFTEAISLNMTKVAEFLNRFSACSSLLPLLLSCLKPKTEQTKQKKKDYSARDQLAKLNEKLTSIERNVSVLEVVVQTKDNQPLNQSSDEIPAA